MILLRNETFFDERFIVFSKCLETKNPRLYNTWGSERSLYNSVPLLDDFLTQARATVFNEHQILRDRLIALTAAQKSGAQPYAINGLMLVEAAKNQPFSTGRQPGKIHEVKTNCLVTATCFSKPGPISLNA